MYLVICSSLILLTSVFLFENGRLFEMEKKREREREREFFNLHLLLFCFCRSTHSLRCSGTAFPGVKVYFPDGVMKSKSGRRGGQEDRKSLSNNHEHTHTHTQAWEVVENQSDSFEAYLEVWWKASFILFCMQHTFTFVYLLQKIDMNCKKKQKKNRIHVWNELKGWIRCVKNYTYIYMKKQKKTCIW